MWRRRSPRPAPPTAARPAARRIRRPRARIRRSAAAPPPSSARRRPGSRFRRSAAGRTSESGATRATRSIAGERDFDDDEHVARAVRPAAANRATRAFAQASSSSTRAVWTAGTAAKDEAGDDRHERVNATTRQSSDGVGHRRRAGRQHVSSALKAPPADEQPENARRQRQHEALDQQLPEDLPAFARRGRSERTNSRCREAARTSSRFATFVQAMSRTKPTAASSTMSGGPHAADELLAQRDHTDGPAGVEVGDCRAMSAAIVFELGFRRLRLSCRRASRPTSAKLLPPRIRCCSGVSTSSLHISGCGENPKPVGSSPPDGNRNHGGHHADDGRRFAVDRDRATDDVARRRIAAATGRAR